MALNELSSSEIQQVAEGVWDAVDWAAAAATAVAAAATTGGFGWTAFAEGAFVEAIGSGSGAGTYTGPGDADTYSWESSGYYD